MHNEIIAPLPDPAEEAGRLELLDKAFELIDALGGWHDPADARARGADGALQGLIEFIADQGGMHPSMRRRQEAA